MMYKNKHPCLQRCLAVNSVQFKYAVAPHHTRHCTVFKPLMGIGRSMYHTCTLSHSHIHTHVRCFCLLNTHVSYYII